MEDEVIKQQVDKFLESNKDCTIKDLIKKSLKITTRTLEFTTKSKSTNPNELRKIAKTHCVGYASMTNSIINYGLSKLGNGEYQSTHWRGKIFVLGYEITNKSNDPFFRDHDYVEIANPDKNIRLRVDPSLYEFTRIGIMNIKYAK